MTGRSIAFDRAADFYDATRGYPPGVAEKVADFLADEGQLRGDQRLLEIGVGTGRLALPVCRHVAQVIGVDLAVPMLRRLLDKRADEPIGVLRGDVTRLPLPDDSFDRALTMHIFHLIEDWRAALRELSRVLRPGALLIEAGDDYPLSDVWDEVNARLPWYRSNIAAGHIPDGFPTLEGFEPASPERRFEYIRATPLARVLQELRDRVWSSTWKLSDAELSLLVETFETVAIERHGSASITVDDPRRVRVQVYRLAS